MKAARHDSGARGNLRAGVWLRSPSRTWTKPDAAANDTIYGLAAAVWTNDIGKAHRIGRSIKAGTVWINCYNVFDPALPFGGYKQSGCGREMGQAVLSNYLETKAITTRL